MELKAPQPPEADPAGTVSAENSALQEEGRTRATPIAYLASRYPAVSHTFIRREVAALRELGMTIHTFSIRRASDVGSLADEDRREVESTEVLVPCRIDRLLGTLVWSLLRAPRRTVRASLQAVLQRPRGLRQLLWSGFHLVEALLLARELDRRGVRHLHCHFANAASQVAMLAAEHRGITWSLMVHGSADFALPHVQMLPRKLRGVQFAAFASYFGRAQAMRCVEPALWEKLHVVRCGVDLQRFAPVREATRACSSQVAAPIELLCVARLSPEKGLWGLLDAFHSCCRQRADLRLSIVGDGPERSRLEGRVRALGLGDRVDLAGALTGAKLLERYRRASVFVLASLMEGVPVVLMEAMLVGVPVVAPRVAGIPELVDHEHTGLLFTPGDWTALSRALLRLCEDARLRERLAAAARPHVLEHHDASAAALPLLRLLDPEVDSSSRR